jgi:hypothetical protein
MSYSKLPEMFTVHIDQVSVHIELMLITLTHIRWLDEDNIQLLGNSSRFLLLSLQIAPESLFSDLQNNLFVFFWRERINTKCVK